MGRSRARMFGAADAVEQPPRRACEMAGAQIVIPRHVGKPSPDTNKRLHMRVWWSQVLAACEAAREVDLATYMCTCVLSWKPSMFPCMVYVRLLPSLRAQVS